MSIFRRLFFNLPEVLKETRMEATYNYKVVRQFAIMTVVWGIVGMLVGVIIAAQLIWPTLTEALGPLAPYLSYGRLRPLHTNAVIFAFGGSGLSLRYCRAILGGVSRDRTWRAMLQAADLQSTASPLMLLLRCIV